MIDQWSVINAKMNLKKKKDNMMNNLHLNFNL